MLSTKSLEKMVQCPYDKSHSIIANRIQTHMVKCRRQHLDVKMIDCPYNSTHQIPECELQFHLESCEQKVGLDSFIYRPENINENKYPLPNLSLKTTENWDNEHHETYNPDDYCKNNPILRNTYIKSSSVKRHFRALERQRMQNILHTHEKAEKEQPRELQQVSRTRPRRPVIQSAGVSNAVNLQEDDISALLEKVKLGANIATLPQLQTKVAAQRISNEESDSFVNKPTPNSEFGWQLAESKSRGKASIRARGKGRGSSLASKN